MHCCTPYTKHEYEHPFCSVYIRMGSYALYIVRRQTIGVFVLLHMGCHLCSYQYAERLWTEVALGTMVLFTLAAFRGVIDLP